jgi:hypothetical protein
MIDSFSIPTITMNPLCRFLPRQKAEHNTLTPQQREDHIAHMYLGNMFLAVEKYAEAEAEYARAHAVFPSEESKRQLALIQMRRLQKSHLRNSSAGTSRTA